MDSWKGHTWTSRADSSPICAGMPPRESGANLIRNDTIPIESDRTCSIPTQTHLDQFDCDTNPLNMTQTHELLFLFFQKKKNMLKLGIEPTLI